MELDPSLLRILGGSLRVLEIAASTNSLLRAEAEVGRAGEGDVLVAEHQTMGRGRFDRRWEAPPGKGLLFSLLLTPDLPPERLPLVSLLVSLAVREGVVAFLNNTTHSGRGKKVTLKWPNDILIGGRKVCGILCETGLDPEGRRFVVAGVGLNVNQERRDFSPDIRRRATSLLLVTGTRQSRGELLTLLLQNLEEHYLRTRREGWGWVVPLWTDRCGTIGRRIEVNTASSLLPGFFVGLEADGALRLRTDDGKTVVVHSGDVG